MMKRAIAVIVTSLLSLSSLPLNAIAAEMGAEEMMFQDIPMVFAATKLATRANRVPNKVVIISESDIKHRKYLYLVDALRDLPGFMMFDYAQQEFGNEILVRGMFQNNKVILLWNGQKVNPPDNANLQMDRHGYGLENVKQIEVVYGPASALYGADAVNAIISVTTKDWDDMKGKHEIGVSYGSYSTARTHAATGFGKGDFKVAVSGNFHDSKGPDFLKEYPDHYKAINSAAFKAAGGKQEFKAPNRAYDVTVRAQLGPDTHLNYMRTHTKDSSAWGFDPSVFEFSEQGVWEQYQDNLTLQHKTKLADKLHLNSTLNYGFYRVEPASNYRNTFFLGFTRFTHGDYKFGRSMKYEINEELIWEMDKLVLIGGVNYANIYSMPKLSAATSLPIDTTLPLSYQTNPNIPYAEINYQSYGVYVQGQYNFTEALSGVVGARADKVWDFKTYINPRVGMTYVPSEKFSLRANYATAVLTPSPYFRYENFSDASFPTTSTSLGALPNKNLRPELYRSAEVGGEIKPMDNVSIDFAAFYNTITDYMLHHRFVDQPYVYVPGIGSALPKTSTAAAAVFGNENGGNITAYGFEITPTVKLGDRGKVWASYAFLDGEQDEQSFLSPTSNGKFKRSLTLISAHSVKGGAEIRVWDQLFVTPTVQYYGPIRPRPGNGKYPNGREMPSVTLVNLALTFDKPRYSLWALIKNLQNRPYMTPGGVGSVLETGEQPQELLTWTIGGSLKF